MLIRRRRHVPRRGHDQLRTWAERAGADLCGNAVSYPASVAFDAGDAGISRGKDVVIVDTAGRLHTSGSLMDEMKKINRVIGKRLPGAPHETLLVLDATIGQNAVVQAKTFAEAIPVTGLVVTKVDGTAKGGVVLAVHEALDVPVKFLGVGEKSTDLVHRAAEFAREFSKDRWGRARRRERRFISTCPSPTEGRRPTAQKL